MTFLPVWLADAAPDISRPGACNPFLTQGKNVVGEITWQQARPACAWGLTSRSQQSPPAAQPTHSSPKHWGQAPRDALGALCRRCLLQATCRSHQAERGWGSEAITAVGCQLQGEDKKCLPVCFDLSVRHEEEQQHEQLSITLCLCDTGQGPALRVGLIVNHGPKGSFISQKLLTCRDSAVVHLSHLCLQRSGGQTGEQPFACPRPRELKGECAQEGHV